MLIPQPFKCDLTSNRFKHMLEVEQKRIAHIEFGLLKTLTDVTAVILFSYTVLIFKEPVSLFN